MFLKANKRGGTLNYKQAADFFIREKAENTDMIPAEIS